MRLSSRLVFDAILLAVVVLCAVLSFSYEPRAGRIPLIVAVLAAGLILVQGWRDLREPVAEDGGIGWRTPVYTLAALAGCVLLVWLVGYLIAMPVFAYGSMVLIGRTGWKTAAAVTAGLWVFVYVLLEVLLRANLS